MDLSTTQATRYSPQAMVSRSHLLRPSTPIEIPFRRRSTSPSPALLSPVQRATSPSSDLLFEMSPLEEQSRLPCPCDNRAFSLCIAEGEIAVSEAEILASLAPTQRTQLTSITRKLYLPPSIHPHKSSPALESKCSTSGPSRDVRKDLSIGHEQRDDCHLTRTPPVIKTTAVKKINGFTPEHPFTLPHEGRSSSTERPLRPHLAPSSHGVTPSSSISSWASSRTPSLSMVDEDDNYTLQSPSAFDFENFLIARLEKRRIRPVSAARVS